jgi:hypothetical protein
MLRKRSLKDREEVKGPQPISTVGQDDFVDFSSEGAATRRLKLNEGQSLTTKSLTFTNLGSVASLTIQSVADNIVDLVLKLKASSETHSQREDSDCEMMRRVKD